MRLGALIVGFFFLLVVAIVVPVLWILLGLAGVWWSGVAGPPGLVRTLRGSRLSMTDPSQMPAITEPLFSEFMAKVEIFPVMNQEDLERGLSQLGGSSQQG